MKYIHQKNKILSKKLEIQTQSLYYINMPNYLNNNNTKHLEKQD